MNHHLKSLLQVILQSDESLVERVVEQFPTANSLLLANQLDFQHVKGITPHRAKKLYTVFQITKELHRPTKPVVIHSPASVHELLATDLKHLEQEHFMCIFLNTKNVVLGTETIAIGTLNACPTHPREIFKSAVKRSCAAIICVHSHPSGDPTPSEEDVKITKRLVEVGEIIGIKVLDHIIIGNPSFVSMAEKGLL